jgi:hypothetical protein
MRKLEIWCEISGGRSVLIVLPGGKLLGVPELLMQCRLAQTWLLAPPKRVLPQDVCRGTNSSPMQSVAAANGQFGY